ncbi:MAG: deoxyribonuclease V [Acidobacteriota bacterium]|nr:deoxyribonuclease V [Acidobacteriota bacterium]
MASDQTWRAFFPPTLAGAAALQRRLAARVDETDRLETIEVVGGADLSYDHRRKIFYAAVVSLEARSGRVIEVGRAAARVTLPYVPGFLSFREGPGVIEALASMRHPPQLLLCDGHGRAHPRRFGLACHLGVALDLPTVGVAKSLLVGEYREPGPRRGSSTALRHKGEVIGRVLRTRAGSRPVFVSVGHRVSLITAQKLVRRWAPRYRLPEPTRLAHLEVSRLRADVPG